MGNPKTDRDREFQEFVAAGWPRLLRTAFLLAGDQHGAEDLVQQALERAYAAWGRVRRADDPSAYLRRILFDEHARRFRRRAPEQLVAAVPDRPDGDGYGQLDTRGALLLALGTLPPRQRQAVVLRCWEDLSETQAAAVMGCSVGTVKSQMAKGIAKLRASSALVDLENMGETA